MSAGNACAAIGLPNTNKVVNIGGYTRHVDPQGPSAWGSVIGVGSRTTFTPRVPPFEDPTVPGGYLVPADSGAAIGKNARLVRTAGALVVPADGLCDVSATGVVTAAAGTGTYKCYIDPGTSIPSLTGLWVYEV